MSSKILSIKELKNYKTVRYDLEVENNHNYFANNILVHNCCCLAHIKNGSVKLMSRQNKEFPGLEHIIKPLQTLQDVILHGELFAKDISFREIISGIKDQAGNEFSKKIEYHVYDVAVAKPYEERLKIINSIGLKHPIVPVQTILVNSKKEIDEWYERFISQGYEGAMLRDPKGIYEFDKRSRFLLKYKKFQDKEYPIIGSTENKGKLKGSCTFKCITPTGKEFDVICEGSYEERCQMWEDWNNGKIKPGDLLTVTYFEFTDDTNQCPRFPVGKAIRKDY